MKHAIYTILAATVASGAAAHDLGFAGLLSNSNMEELPQITLTQDAPLATAPLMLKSGTGYELEITSDGSGEMALEGPGFFRAIWINEIVINDLEIRPFGIDSLEFDDAGTMEIEFIAIKPGRYSLRMPGSEGETRRIDIIIQ